MSYLQSLSKLQEIQSTLSVKSKTLILFSAPGCAPCKVLHPIIEKVAMKYPDDIGFLYVESDDTNGDTFNYYNISGVPTIILFRGTDAIAFRNGFRSEGEVIEWLAEKLV